MWIWMYFSYVPGTDHIGQQETSLNYMLSGYTQASYTQASAENCAFDFAYSDVQFLQTDDQLPQGVSVLTDLLGPKNVWR